jgi:hypothetical protein
VYRFHQGYWGPHIGFYGGINYGFGYNGDGFHGGYWNHNQFYYNRSVTNINTTVIHNTYNYKVVTVNNYRNVSYNGGPGGVPVRPTPAQVAVLHEPHVNPLPQQIEHREQAAKNRAQYASANGGRPAELVAPKPIVLAHVNPSPGLANPGVRGELGHPAPALRPSESRPAENRPAENHPMEQNRPAEGHPMEQHPAENMKPGQQHPMEQHPMEQHPMEQQHPAQQHPMEQNHPAAKPEPRPEQRPAPQQHQEVRPSAKPEAHPAARPAEHPAAKPEAHPQQHEQAKPQEHKPNEEHKNNEEKRPQ